MVSLLLASATGDARDQETPRTCQACHASYRVVYAEPRELLAEVGTAGSFEE